MNNAMKWVASAAAVFTIVLTCAFGNVPTHTLLSSDGQELEISVAHYSFHDGILSVELRADMQVDEYEIAKDLIVSDNPEMNNGIHPYIRYIKEGSILYEYKMEKADELYYSMPVLYKAGEISMTAVSPLAGAVAYGENGEPWFEVDECSCCNDESAIIVYIRALSEDVPRFPKLVAEDVLKQGITSMDFDDQGHFIGGEFIFNVEGMDEAEVASLLRKGTIYLEDELLQFREEPKSGMTM